VTACRLAHRVDGPLGAPTVVLSNSLGSTWAMWEPQVPALSETHRVLRYDHRGHGGSATPAGPYSVAELGEDLVALLDELDVATASFVGLSLGGMVGMWVAAHHPERIEHLVLMCTSAVPGASASWEERAALVQADGTAAVADAVVGRWFTPEFAASDPALVSRMTAMVSATPAVGYAACCHAIAGLDLRAECRRIAAPTLVLGGAEDPAMPPATHARLVAELVPDARYVELSPAAHLASVEQAEAVTALVLAHLSGRDVRVDEGMQP
jgi:3-oxoadipate enol-lactonase